MSSHTYDVKNRSRKTLSEKVTLKKFICDNYPLIASLGVFGALTTLFTRFTDAPYLSFISFAIFFILTWEFIDSFPEIEMSSIRFVAFEFLTVALFIFVGLYIFTTYVATFWKLFVFLSLLVVYSAILITLYLRLKLSERIQKKIPEGKLSIAKMVILLSVMLVLMFLAIYSANYIIDSLRQIFPQIG